MLKKEEIFPKLKQYMEIEAMSRYEDDVVDALKNNTKNANVTYQRDGLGSLIIIPKNNEKVQGPKIMLAAHMDEVAYVVNQILDNGQLLVKAVGGIWPTTVVGTRAKLITSTQQIFSGIFGHTSIHVLEATKINKAITTKDLFVDFGFKDKQHALDNGVNVGDKIYLSGETFVMEANNDLVVGKAMDNRAGVTILDLVINALKDQTLPNQAYFVGTVQEEVGTRGAQSSVSVIQPDIAIAIDTTASHDTHQIVPGTQKLGMGVAIRMMDGSTMMDPKLVAFIKNLAQKHEIPIYKFVSQGGGTDAAKLQYGPGGVATICLSIPQRYLHSPLGVCDLNDIYNTAKLLIEFFKTFNNEAWETIRYK